MPVIENLIHDKRREDAEEQKPCGKWKNLFSRMRCGSADHVPARSGPGSAAQILHSRQIRAGRQEFRGDRPPDEVLIERVRAQLGHVVSYPGSLDVKVDDGCVIVSGPVFAGELAKIHDRLQQTRGVCDFDLQVTEHLDTEGIPGLQGESRWQPERQAI